MRRDITEEMIDDTSRDRFFYDVEEIDRYADRKRDWHKNKGKRRIKGGYKGDRYV